MHRDIAPRNFLVQKVNDVHHALVCDFGLSKILPADSASGTGRMDASETLPVPMAPEVGCCTSVW